MFRISMFAGFCAFLALTCATAQDAKKDPPKKTPPIVEELLKLTPDQFIKRFDKDGDGFLSKDELPMFLGKAFDASDKNGDGKLDREEVAALQKLLRNFFAAGAQPKTPPPSKEIEQIINNLLKQFDTDKDGKISRNEAKGFILNVFDQFDANQDGFLDRKELRALAERIEANQKKFPQPKDAPAPAYDFDALDKNADGRLTKEELKGTPLYARFAEIDTDGNGMIDRREFEAFLERENAKRKKDQKK
jgi:Ca2+-binding EF-hand superfamily protein